MSPSEGVLLVDKAPGPTSHDLVLDVRRCTGQARVGHTGTLDPAAEGLLVLVLGRATRLARFLPHQPKDYRGSFEIGWITDTEDATGRVLERLEGLRPDLEQVRAAARSLLGESMQVPPAYSAKKVHGRRLYDAARRGLLVAAPPSPIVVSRFDLQPTQDPTRFEFFAEVSTGTYVRSLIRDLGCRLGYGATLTSLRRTKIGPFVVEDAIRLAPTPGPTLDEVLSRIIPLGSLRLDLPSLRLADDDEVRWFVHGRILTRYGLPSPAGCRAVEDPDGVLLGIGEPVVEGLRARVVL